MKTAAHESGCFNLERGQKSLKTTSITLSISFLIFFADD
jgi:hypothetical protein